MSKNIEISTKSLDISSTLRTVVVTTLVFVGSQFLAALFITSILIGVGIKPEKVAESINQNDMVRFFLLLTIDIIVVWFVFLLLRRAKEKFANIGVAGKLKIKHVVVALKAYAAYFVMFLFVISLAGALGLFNTNQAQDIGFHEPHGYHLVIAFVSLVVLPPIAEEIVFRGYLYHRLKKSTRTAVAVLITAILFASAHLEIGSGGPLNWAAAVDTFILSFALTYVTERSKSLWPAMLVHAIKNAVAFTALFLIK